MPEEKKNRFIEKSKLHPKNKHREAYDFRALATTYKDLNTYVFENKHGNLGIDFFNPQAVKALNKAILLHHYQLKYWDIPDGHLCPPIPGRADYIHYLADLLDESKKQSQPVNCLDIGVGTNCIYPLIGNIEYGWTFVGADISPTAISSSQKIIDNNPSLKKYISLRLQKNPNDIFRGIIKESDYFDITLCNPPFHDSAEAAHKATNQKLYNLSAKDMTRLNFGGQHHELWCKGGELEFVKKMIRQSQYYTNNCSWFTCLISKKENLRPLKVLLKKIGVATVRVITMEQGNKQSRMIAWRFSASKVKTSF
ncbi:MAG: 23S rRNA (adenine(1618)-N(6))-methyltransferase RlmF [Flavicella sp.]